MALHEACCAAHETRIRALTADPEFRAERDWILANAW